MNKLFNTISTLKDRLIVSFTVLIRRIKGCFPSNIFLNHQTPTPQLFWFILREPILSGFFCPLLYLNYTFFSRRRLWSWFWKKNINLSHRIIDSFSRVTKWTKNNTRFVSPERPKAKANKTGINLIPVENCVKLNAIYDFSVRLRTGSNPLDSNRFPSHTGKRFTT